MDNRISNEDDPHLHGGKVDDRQAHDSLATRSCVVIGSTTLAIYCTEQIRTSGHEVRLIFATDDVFRKWAIREGIRTVDSMADVEEILLESSVDWLFSIVNPYIVPASLLERVGIGAFNYHDSPLPRYAGTYATSWALMAQETEYAITWHTITTTVDAGQIAIQQPVIINPQDTVLSLNLKCYQAARKSFAHLLMGLAKSKLVTSSQDPSQRTFYKRSHRPQAGGCLNWTQTAESLSAIVRALDFGDVSANPITCPKIILNSDIIQVVALECLEEKSPAVPGTLVNASVEGMRVATGSKDVMLTKLATLEGEPINYEILAEELESTKQLPVLKLKQATKIKQVLEDLTKYEKFWHDRLELIFSIQLPYETISKHATSQWATSEWKKPCSDCFSRNPRSVILAAFLVYLARLTGQSRFQIGYKSLFPLDESTLSKILASVVPMECDINLCEKFVDVIDNVEKEMKLLERCKTYPRDLISRHPTLRSINALKYSTPWRIGISMEKGCARNQQIGKVLTLQIDIDGRYRWIHDTRFIKKDALGRISQHLQTLVQSAITHSDNFVGKLNLVPETEKKFLLHTLNDVKTSFPGNVCVHKLFESQVEQVPKATAIIFGNEQLTYEELNGRANRLAHRLLQLRVVPNTCVAILLNRSVELIVAQLAILKVGAVYVPLDPTAPLERHMWILNNCSVPLLITDVKNIELNIQILDVHEYDLGKECLSNSYKCGLSSSAAYVMYTSGSMGKPKGVLVSHKGITNLVMNNYYVQSQQRVAFISNPGFDASTFEVWAPLLNGATIVIIERDILLNPMLFSCTLQKTKVEVLFLTTALMFQYISELDDTFQYVQTLLFGGDVIDQTSLRKFVLHEKSPKNIINVYGPTETTTFTTSYKIERITDEHAAVPIGRPLANICIYLLDNYGQPVPFGAMGEIYIGGYGVAIGYMNQPDLTTERFTKDPFSNEPDAKMYKTGDLARYHTDGNLIFLGRNDRQVKIRNFRIEPSEIEAKICEHPAVRHALVVATHEGEKRLIMYVETEYEIPIGELREYLVCRLPDYMIPAAFIKLDKFPLTLNGKIDYRALPVPDANSLVHALYEPPIGSIEKGLAEIWSSLLGVSKISRNDSFFALGGHSLSAVRLLAHIAALGIEIPLTILYAKPILADFALVVKTYRDTENTVRPSIMKSNHNGILPLSFAQQRLWFLAQIDGVSNAYHIPFTLRVEGVLQLDSLQKALNTLWARHEALRSVFSSIDGQPHIRLLNSRDGLALRILKINDETDLERICSEEAQMPFNLADGPLVRALLIQIAKNLHVFMLTQHHIVSDGWSIGIIMKELHELYKSHLNKKPALLPPLSIQYPDYAAWQRQWVAGKRLYEQSNYWRTTLADAPFLLNLPTDRPRPPQQSFIGDFVPIELDVELTMELKRLCEKEGVTMFISILAAWAIVLSKLSGQDEIVIGVPSANRGYLEIQDLIGFFVNALAMRIDIQNQPTISQLLTHVKNVAVQAQTHQDLPLEHVVDIVQPPRRLDYTPLFQVVFAWQEYKYKASQWKEVGLDVKPIEPKYNVVKFDLELNLTEIDNRIVGSLGYSTALYNRNTIKRQVRYLETVLKEIATDTDRFVSAINIVDAHERELLIKTWNNTKAAYPHQLCVHELFENQAKYSPNSIAVIYSTTELSYNELNKKANQVAHALINAGVEAGDFIPILLDRSTDLIIVQLAILKTKAIYVPLDVQAPIERHAWIIRDCSARLLVTDARNVDFNIQIFRLNDASIYQMPSLNPIQQSSSLDIAYLMYTSGSTGTPKGVLIPHRGIIRLVRNNGYCEFHSHDRVGCIANTSFDASTFEIWGTLLNGGTLVVFERELILNPYKFCTALKDKNITIILFTAAFLNQIVDAFVHVRPQLDTLIVGADVLEPRSINVILSKAPPKHFLNAYGPTESTTIATTYRIVELIDDHSTVPIGRPISNTQVYLLDAYLQLVPIGSIGELYIGGDGVAHSYLNRKDLTSESFLPDPFRDNGIIYKTGDLARYLSDGNLVYIGRNDQQVKVRGFRIEPSEIEARLSKHPNVREAVVVLLKNPEKRLVAYVVSDHVNPNSLREYLSPYLPDYMIPAAFVQLNEIPLLSNGKVNRRILPIPKAEAFARGTYEEPVGDIEITLAKIWSDLLGIDKISRYDSFFNLGGHSLLAVQLNNRIASLGIELPLSTIFTSSTLTTLAEAIEGCQNIFGITRSPIKAINRNDSLPLSFEQKRIWILSQFDGANEAYHVPLRFHLKGQLDYHVWQEVLKTLWCRHEVLRSVFVTVDGKPEVRLLDIDKGIDMRVVDLHDLTQVDTLCSEEVLIPFDMRNGPLVRSLLIRLEDKMHVFLITLHHIIFDGFSCDILMREVSSLYRAYCKQQLNPLVPLRIQYYDYTTWQHQWLSSENLKEEANYWKSTLLNAPSFLKLPTDYPRPVVQSYKGDFIQIQLDIELTKSLKRISQQRDMTLFTTLLTAWAAVLARLSGQDEIMIGTPSTNRRQSDTECLIGFFVNTLPIRVDLRGQPSITELLLRVKNAVIQAQTHQGLPFEKIVDLIQAPRRLDCTPVFQVMFAWQNRQLTNWTSSDIEINLVETRYDFVKFDMELTLIEEIDYIKGTLGYSSVLFSKNTAERYIKYYKKILEEVANDSSANLIANNIEILDLVDRKRLLHDWNCTNISYNNEACFHEIFENVVLRSPNCAALVFEDKVLNYAELNVRANKLAHRLMELGAGPDMCIALCANRSFEMIVSFIAILKAGAAYLPLDPSYPGKRLIKILDDANPIIVLADKTGRLALGEDFLASKKVLDPDTCSHYSSENPTIRNLKSGHLAYIIYTSGSTGIPKGAMIEHRGLINLMQDQTARFSVQETSRILQFASCSFDASIFEIVMALGSGASLHLISDSIRKDPIQFMDYLHRHDITHVTLPPALIQAWKNMFNETKGITYIIAGDVLNAASFDILRINNTIFNAYGLTETTICSTVWRCPSHYTDSNITPIGRPISNTHIYLLDSYRQPVPLGTIGEIYISGDGVARGYLNQPDLTTQYFFQDPFLCDKNSNIRMYKTGDLAYYLPDGNLVHLGRIDDQTKIRGFRIQLSEIETRLLEHPAVHETVVVTLGEQEKRLVAYVVADSVESITLHEHLRTYLPDFMIPSTYVHLDKLPLSFNGKIDRQALPNPGSDALSYTQYEEPVGSIEHIVAQIWRDILGVERIGRYDSFFALGGHSLLAIAMIDRLRQYNLTLSIRELFQMPVLATLAQNISHHNEVLVPPNLITDKIKRLTPDLFPLIDLTQNDLDQIAERVKGGVANIQDIYALSPLQEGILFHYLSASKNDPYLAVFDVAFDDRATLDKFVSAIQQIINRHDILRTAFLWEHISLPVQVVWRKAELSITESKIDTEYGSDRNQLNHRQYKIDITKAPCMHLEIVANETEDNWILIILFHHLIGDHTTLDVLFTEAKALTQNSTHNLPKPIPFRNLIAQICNRSNAAKHEVFFKKMLIDVSTPTLPFELTNVHQDGLRISESRYTFSNQLNRKLREQAKRLGVNLASLCHVAYAQVLSVSSGQKDVVFGTVLLGRMQASERSSCSMGVFINTLPIRININNTSVEETVCNVHSLLGELLEHEYASLPLAQRCSSVPSGTPLFSAILNYRHVLAVTNGAKDAFKFKNKILRATERTNYPFTVSFEDFGSKLGVTSQTESPIDPNRVCRYIEQALLSLTDALEHNPHTPIRGLRILPDDEQELLLNIWNDTKFNFSNQMCIHQLFEQQVRCTPNTIGAIFASEEMTYAQLNIQANHLAHQILSLGVAPDEPIVICVERSMSMVIGLLAILKAGAAYVPLDPKNPAERLTRIINDVGSKIIIADNTGRYSLKDLSISCTILDPSHKFDQPDKNPKIYNLTSRNLAYIMYTSGSTGIPKGVQIEHRAVINRIEWMQYEFQLISNDRILQKTPYNFDVSVLEIFLPLLNGATLVLAPSNAHKHVNVLVDLIIQKRITMIHFVPSILQSFLNTENVTKCCHLKHLTSSGESLSAADVQLCQKVLPHVQISNLYGPTETTVDVTFWKCPDRYDKVEVPIGRPIWNTKIYLLNENNLPVPVGAIGELCVAGIGVARGYLNRPDLTTNYFLPDPFSNDPNARMYKTGDLAKYMTDGNLLILGRNDQQIKIRGIRIEPGEIEINLMKYPGICNAVVIATEESCPRLVAYVVADKVEPLKLRKHLNYFLPESIVPSIFVRLDKIPLTSNGKLDRRALPPVDDSALARAAYEAPIGFIETALVQIWQDLLGVDVVSRNDSFFALGGHSLLVVQLAERLRRQNLSFSVHELFKNPDLATLATTLKQFSSISVPPNEIHEKMESLTPANLPLIDLTQNDINRILKKVPSGLSNVQDIYDITHLQKGILFHHLLSKHNDPFLLISQMAFVNRDLLDCYVKAFQKVINRHDNFRTAFIYQDISVPAQVVWRHAPLSVTELLFDPKDGPIQVQLMGYCTNKNFRLDVTTAPLLQFFIARDKNRWIMNIVLHHLIADHTTVDILFTEAQAFLESQHQSLPSPVPFRNVIAQIRFENKVKDHKRFFEHMLADVTEPTLPFGLANVHFNLSKINETRVMLSAEVNKKLRFQAKRYHVSVASLCHMAWAQVLSHISGQIKVVFGTVLFGRMHAGESSDRTMGMLINTLPIRIDVDETEVSKCIHNVHMRLAGLMEHEFASLSMAQQCSQVPHETPLFTALLNYRHNSNTNLNIEGIEVLETHERTNYPFTLSVEDSGSSLGLTALILEPIESRRVCEYMETALMSLVSALEMNPNLPAREVEILPKTEREFLSIKLNETKVSYPDVCIHQLFEEQVKRTPDSPALLFHDKSMSYATLNSLGNKLAYQLVDCNVKPDSLVVICVEPSLAMIIGIFAILKAGAAYVPLDPNNPSERLIHILNDVNPIIVFADEIGRKALGKALFNHKVIDPNHVLDNVCGRDDFQNSEPNLQISSLTSKNLAYIIYTSGSTGVPKGVMIEHRSLVNYSLYAVENYKIANSRGSLLATSIAFDLVLTTLFPPLISGVSLRIACNEWDQIILQEKNLSPVKLTPSHLAFFENDSSLEILCKNSHNFVIGGEALYASSLKKWFDKNSEICIFNEYGPTETTVGCTVYKLTPETIKAAGNIVPIGRPISNTRIYIVDSFGHLAPLGAIGEIYIGGQGLARGYLNRPDLTAEKFLPDPFVNDPEARVYKTGDLAQFLPNGNLIFLGRNDDQIKVRGYRVEPAEIEAKLVQDARVREAFVTTFGEDKRLVAYVVPDSPSDSHQVKSDLSISEPDELFEFRESLEHNLQKYLCSCLPDYMVPTVVMCVEEFPLTSNGKIDRRALPVPNLNRIDSCIFESPVGPVETILAEIWRELLQVDKVGRHDSFFALGGHSLIAVKMIHRAMSSGIVCSLNELFKHPILSNFASHVSSFSKYHTEAILVRSGSEKPIFFVPTGLGDYSYVFSLASQISDKYPVYALPWPSASEISEPTIQTLTDIMINNIKNVQPEGPYKVAGYSAGGILSYEIAKSLLNCGESVDFLGLIDCTPPYLLENLSNQTSFYNYLRQNIEAESFDKLMKLIEGKTEIDLDKFIHDADQVKLLNVNLPHEFFITSWERIKIFTKAVKSCKPVSLSTKVYYFYATEKYTPDARIAVDTKNLFQVNRAKVWEEILPDTHVHSVPIPGNHYTMLTDVENRKFLGDAFSQALDKLNET